MQYHNITHSVYSEQFINYLANLVRIEFPFFHEWEKKIFFSLYFKFWFSGGKTKIGIDYEYMMIIDLDNDGVIMFTKMSRSIFFCFCYCAIHSNIEYTRVVMVVVVDLWMWNSIQYNSFRLVDGSIDIIIGIICAWKKNNIIIS